MLKRIPFLLFACFTLLAPLSAQWDKSQSDPIPTPRGGFPVDPMEAVDNGRSTNTVLAEDFQDIAPPSLPNGWTSLSAEGDFRTGDASDANAVGTFPVPDIPGNIFAMANDDVCNCDMSNIRLITPSIDLSGLSSTPMVLRFNAYHDGNWGGGDATVQASDDGGSTWDTLQVLNTSTSWQYYVLNLSAYTGSANVQLKFQWSDGGTWASGFAVDNVVVDELLDNDLRVEKVRTTEMNMDLEYTELPLDQAEEMTLGGRIKNNGSALQTNTHASATLERNGQTLYSGTSSSSDLDSMERNMYWVASSFTPDSTGLYKVNVEALSDQNEEYPADNMKSDSVRFTCDRFSRDRGNYSGHSLGNGTYSSGDHKGFEAGNLFGIRRNSEMVAVRVLLDSSSQAGASIRGHVHRLDTATGDFNNVAVTPPQTVQSGDISSPSNPVWTELSFDAPVELDSNEYYLITASLEDPSTEKVEFGTSGISPHETSYFFDDSSDTWTDVNATPMVRLITSSFSLTLPDDTTICADSTLTLDAGPGDSYEWSTGKESRSVEVSGPDSYWVTVTQGGCQGTDSIQVDTVQDCATGIQDHEGVPHLGIHPNPAGRELQIEAPATLRIHNIEVIDLQGKMVQSFPSHHRLLDLSGIPEGAYILRLRTERGVQNLRFVRSKRQ